MVTLYYGGHGEVEIQGSHVVRGVEIRDQGNIEVEKTAGDNFVLAHYNKGIIIFPIGEGYLQKLYKFRGKMKIISVIVADNNGEQIPCKVKRTMDYSELLNSTSETMTTNSEDLSSGYDSVIPLTPTPQIIENMNTNDKNLHTGDTRWRFYLEDGTIYEGDYHIHLDDISCMTGGVHNENSQHLYYKREEDGIIIDKLIPTNNPSRIPRAFRHRREPPVDVLVKREIT